MLLAGVIPLLAFLSIFLTLASRKPELGWRRAFTRASVLWGTTAIVLTELLSLLTAVRSETLAAGWLVLTLALTIDLIRKRRVRRELPLPPLTWPTEPVSWAALTVVLTIVLITGVVAWFAPPNTWDSLNYHMSRVAHWAQMSAVRHYATGIEVQNNMPPGAEILVLNLYVLAMNDQLANLVQWFAMLGSLVGVSLIARQLGAGRIGQWVSVVFAATLPMGIIQASSTMTDYVVALWVVAAAAEALAIWKSADDQTGSPAYVGLAIGLGILAKPTAFSFMAPLALIAALGLARHAGFKTAVRASLVIVGIALILNIGYFARNVVTYRNPISPTSRINEHRSEFLGGRGLLSNLLRNAALHAGTPVPYVNKALALAVQEIHRVMDLDLSDPRTTSTGKFKVSAPTTNENRAGNPLHAWLSLPVLVLVFVRPELRSIRTYAAITLLTFVLFSQMFKWQAFGSRYHLPFFLLLAPVFGAVSGKLGRGLLPAGLIGGLFVASWPWLIGIDSRPVLPTADQSSVLTASRQDLYFANAQYLQRPYIEMTALLDQAQCRDIGISLDGSGQEYPLWVLMGAPDPDLRLDWIVAGTPSAIYREVTHRPCAIICQHCPTADVYAGLHLVYERTEFKLYMETND